MDIQERIEAICGELKVVRLPRWNELPDIELYMDQVIVLMGKYMQGIVTAEDKILTPSMVNNYVKMGIMPAPVKKKYSRSHLAHLIVICVMKRVVPIALIQRFIETSLETLNEQQLLDMTAEYYEAAAASVIDRLKEQVASVEETGAAAVNFLAASAAIRSQIELNIAEKLSAE